MYLVFFLAYLLSSHIMVVAILKRTTQWFLVSSETGTTMTNCLVPEHFLTPQKKPCAH